MLIPSPTEYLKTHIIAFLAGAATMIAAHIYAKAVNGDFDD
jgi:hypothetical protein